MAQNENLACVLCENFVGVKSEEVIQADGSIIIVCDNDVTPGRDKRVTLIPNVSAEGGATITSTSAHGCSRTGARLLQSDPLPVLYRRATRARQKAVDLPPYQ
mgnify:CR=1 FL=1